MAASSHNTKRTGSAWSTSLKFLERAVVFRADLCSTTAGKRDRPEGAPAGSKTPAPTPKCLALHNLRITPVVCRALSPEVGYSEVSHVFAPGAMAQRFDKNI